MEKKKEKLGGINSRNMSYEEAFNRRIEDKTKKNARKIAEKGYSAELNNRGLKSYFEECFEKVSLDEQELPIVGPFEDITTTESFQAGRKRGQILVANGYTEEIYYEKYLPEFEEKYSQSKKHR